MDIDADDIERYRIDEYEFNEPRNPHKSKRNSKRSNHKHEYIDVMLVASKSERMYPGRVCSICGRVDDISWNGVESNDSNLPTIYFENDSHFDLAALFRLKYVSVSGIGREG